MRFLLILLLASPALARTTATGRTDAGTRSAVEPRAMAPAVSVPLNRSGMDGCSFLSSAGMLSGSTTFCVRGDGTSWDGGLAFTAYPTDGGGPVIVDAPFYPQGVEHQAAKAQRFDGGTGVQYASADTASIDGDLSCVLMIRRWGAVATQYPLTKTVGASGPVIAYVSATTFSTQVVGLDAGSTSVTAGAGTQLQGAFGLFGFTYHYVTDLGSSLTMYAGGTASGVSTTAVGPLRTIVSPWRLSGYSATAGFFDGDIAFAACSETAWTATQHAQLYRALSGLRGSTGLAVSPGDTSKESAVTFTRASTATCANLDGSLRPLASNQPCLTSGLRVEPAGTNALLQSQTFSGWTLSSNPLSDGGPVAAPVVGAVGSCPYLAPDGTGAVKVDFPAVSDLGTSPVGYSRLQLGITTTAAPWTTSLYLRAADATDGGTLWASLLSAPAVGLAADSGWTRPSVTYTPGAATRYVILGPNTNIAGEPATQPALSVCLWGAQAELGSIATSYIPTTTAAATRAAETATIVNPLFGSNPTNWCVGGPLTPAGTAYSQTPFASVAHLSASYAGANSAGLFVGSDGKPLLRVWDVAGGGAYKQVVANAAVTFGTHTYFGCSSNGSLTMWVDGTQPAQTVTAAAGGTGIISTQPDTVMIGSMGSGYQPGGSVANVKILAQSTPEPPRFSFLPASDSQLDVANECSGTALTAAKGGAVTFTRATTHSCTKTDGTVVQLGSGVPAVTASGVKVRAVTVNRQVYSQALDSWILRGSAAVTSDQFTAPDGTLTGDSVRVAAVATGDMYQNAAGAGVANAACTPSIWLTGLDAGGTLTIANAQDATRGRLQVPLSILPMDGGWLRVYQGLAGTTTDIAFTNTAAGAASMQLYSQDAGPIVFGAWGGQVSDGALADYCGPTTTTSKTCNAETATMVLPSNVTNTEGCASGRVYIDHVPVAGGEGILGFNYPTGGALYTTSATLVRLYDGTNMLALTVPSMVGSTHTFRIWWHAGSSRMGLEWDGVAATPTTYDGSITATPVYFGSLAATGQVGGPVRNVELGASRFGCQL